MLQTRSRLITFRLSEEEYDSVRALCAAQGARSVSGFVRSSVIWVLSNWDRRVKDILFISAPIGERPSAHSSSAPGTPQNSDRTTEWSTRREPAPDLRDAVSDLKMQVELLSKVIREFVSGRQDVH